MPHFVTHKNTDQTRPDTLNIILVKGLLFAVLIFNCLFSFGQVELVDENGQKINVDLFKQKANEQVQQGDNKEASRYINAIAAGYWNHKNYHKAIEYYLQSIDLNTEIENESGIAGISNNLGMIYADLQDYENSLKYFNTAIVIRKKLNEKAGRISAHINASVVLNKLERYDESAQNLEEALLLATEMSDADQMKSCYGMLAETYEKSGEGDKMIKYYNLYRTFHEMVEKNKNQQALKQARESELRAQYMEAQKRIKELELINTNRELEEKNKLLTRKDTIYQNLMEKYSKNELAIKVINRDLKIKDLTLKQSEADLKKEQRYVNALTIAIVIFCLFMFYLLFSYRQKKKSNEILRQRNNEINRQHVEILEQKSKIEESYTIISEKNTSITSSINYAKLIQEAVLGSKENIKQFFPESFVFFKPKDIVSGDFYWFKSIGDKTFVAAGDCTGHGVPGALMSMLSINLIDQIVDSGTIEMHHILKKLNIGVINALNPGNSNKIDSRDGMDIAFFAVNKKEKTIEFAGARNPLVYIQNNELHLIKGDKISIGSLGICKTVQDIEFAKHQVDVSVPTMVYIFSDGFVDQFNENDNKKFLMSRFRKLLLSIHLKPVAEQEAILEQTLSDWKGKQTQIDDIIVLGIRL